jgi:hypothetical protein
MSKGIVVFLMAAALLTAVASIFAMEAASSEAANKLTTSELPVSRESRSPLCWPRVSYVSELGLETQLRVLQIPSLICP